MIILVLGKSKNQQIRSKLIINFISIYIIDHFEGTILNALVKENKNANKMR